MYCAEVNVMNLTGIRNQLSFLIPIATHYTTRTSLVKKILKKENEERHNLKKLKLEKVEEIKMLGRRNREGDEG